MEDIYYLTPNEYEVLKTIFILVGETGDLNQQLKGAAILRHIYSEICVRTGLEEFRVRSIIGQLLKKEFISNDSETVLTTHGSTALADYPLNQKKANKEKRKSHIRNFIVLSITSFLGAVLASVFIEHGIPWIKSVSYLLESMR